MRLRRVRSVASTVLLAVALAPLPATAATAAAAAPPPPPVERGFVPGRSVELPDRRNRTSKTFHNPDGTFTTQVATGSIHAKENGAWVDIETDLVTRGDGRHHARRLPFGLAFGADEVGEVATVSVKGTEIGFSLAGTRRTGQRPVLRRNTIRYPNVFRGVDLTYRVHGDGYKQNFVVAGPGAPTDYTFAVRSPADVTFTQRADGGIDLKRGGTWLAEIPPPFMAEADGDLPTGVRSADVRYALSGAPGTYRIGVHADRAWLDAPGRRYPVLIDPTLNVAISNDQSTCSGVGYENMSFSDLGVGYENAIDAPAPRNKYEWCKGWLRFDLTPVGATTVTSATLDLVTRHSYDGRHSLVYVDELLPKGWSGSGYESDLTYRGGTYYPGVRYASADTGMYYNSRFSLPVTSWAQGNTGTFGSLMIESGAPPYYSAPLPSGTATEQQHLYKLFYASENAPSTNEIPRVTVNWTGTTPWLTNLYPVDGGAEDYPNFSAIFNDSDPGATGYAKFEVWNETATTRLYTGNGLGNASSGSVSIWYPGITYPSHLASGRYRWRAAAYDGSLQSAWSAFRSLTVDRVAPTTPTNPSWPAGPATKSPTVTAQWTPGTDTLTDVISHRLQVSTKPDDPATPTDEFAANIISTKTTGSGSGSYSWFAGPGKTYYFKASSIDRVGNASAYSVQSPGLTVDMTKPGTPGTLSSTSHATGVASGDTTVDLAWTAATDEATGIGAYEVLFDGSQTPTAGTRKSYPGTARTGTSDPLTEGTWYAHVRAVDGAGNAGDDVTYGPIVIDTTGPAKPTVSCPTHVSGQWTASRTLVCDITSEAGTAQYRITLQPAAGGTAEVTTQAQPAYTKDFTADGAWDLTAQGSDALGNWSVASDPYAVRVDATKPAPPTTSSSTHPAGPGWYPINDIAWAWSATDTSPIKGYAYVVDRNATTEAPFTPLRTNKSVTSQDRADGLWYLHVRAQNEAGLWSDTRHRVARVDVTAPAGAVATSGTHPQGEALSRTDVSMSWSASPGSDATSGVAGYSYDFTADPAAPVDDVLEPAGTSTTRTLTTGTWYFHLRTIDKAGNATETVYGPVVVDPYGPPVSAADRDRFLGLWLPRVESETFYEDWFASDGVPQYVIDEGFHGLPDATKHYLADRLWEAFTATRGNDPSIDSAGREVMYEFVFDKEAQEDPPDPSRFQEDPQPVTPGQDISKPRPAAVQQAIDQSAGAYDTVAAAVNALPPLGTSALPLDVPLIPVNVDEVVSSALSGDALAEVQRLAAAGNPVGEVLARLARVDAGHGVTVDSRAVFALPDRLPIGYTACWDTATFDGCEDALLVGQPVDIDVSGDGSDDLTVTFGPGTGSTPPAIAPLTLNVKRRVLPPPVPGVPQPPASDLSGKQVKAHVWIVYELDAASAPAPGRLQFGFDGFVRGERLADSSTLTFTPTQVLDAAQRDLGGTFTLSHTWPNGARPKWALTVGRRAVTGDPDPLDAALTFDAATNVSGEIAIRNDDSAVNTVQRSMMMRFDTAVTAPLTADVKETISSANETTEARVVLTSVPAGTRFDTFRRREAGTNADETEITVDNNANPSARLPRLAGVATITNDRGKDHVTFDVRDVPADTTLYGLRAMDGSFAYQYDSSAASGPIAASLRTLDSGGVLTFGMQATASSLPTGMNVTYGPATIDDRTLFVASSSARLADLSFTGYDRALGLTVDAELTDVPTYVAGEVSPGASYFNVVAGQSNEAGVGYASGVISAGGGDVSRRTGEHATLLRDGDAIGASFRLRGARSGRVVLEQTELGGAFTLDPGSFSLTNPFDIAFDIDGIQGLLALSNMPQTADVAVDLGSTIAVTGSSSGAVDRLVFYGRHPSGILADGAVAQLPPTMRLDATLSSGAANATFSGSASGADVERVTFSTDSSPGSGTGVTVSGAATDLPARMTLRADRTAKTASYAGSTAAGAPEGIGVIDVQVSYKGAKARVPVGQHATFTGTTSAWGASLLINGVTGFAADVNAGLTAGHAKLTLAQRGGPVTIDLGLDTLRAWASLTNVPTSVEIWADLATRSGRYVASDTLDKVQILATKTNVGPTVTALIENAPTSVTVSAAPVGTAWNVKVDSSAPVRRAAVSYSDKYLARGTTATSEHISIDAQARSLGTLGYTDMPKTVDATFDLGARSLKWRSPTPIYLAEMHGRGAILHGWTVSADVTGVPAEFDAQFGVNTKLFDGRGGRVGRLKIKATNHATLLPDHGTGNHVTGVFDLSDDQIDIAADVYDVGSATFTSGDKSVGIKGSATNNGLPLRADVTVDDLVPADGSNEFTVQMAGTVTKIPDEVTVTVKPGTLDYDSVGRLGGQLQLFAGWRNALASAPPPNGVDQGISVTDGACAPNGCNPDLPDGSPRFLCSQTKDTCYGARAVITHTDFPTHISAELRNGLTVPLVTVSGFAAGSLRLRADLRHVIDDHLVVDLTQNGIPANGSLTLGPVTVAGTSEGTEAKVVAGATPRAGLLIGTVEMPEKTFAFGQTPQGESRYEISEPRAMLLVTALPSSVTVTARWGRTPRVAVNTTEAVSAVSAAFSARLRQRNDDGALEYVDNADNPACYARLKFCGRLDLSNLPAAPTQPIVVSAGTARYGVADTRVFEAPDLAYTAPAAGADLVVNVDRGLLALADGQADLYFDTVSGDARARIGRLTARATALPASLSVDASVDRRSATVAASGSTGSLYVEGSDFEITAAGRTKEGIPVPQPGPKLTQWRVALGGTVILRGGYSHVTLESFTNATIAMDEFHLGFGLSGQYGRFELGIDDFELQVVDPTVSIGLRLGVSLPWNKDFFSPSVRICSCNVTLHNFTPVVMNADDYGTIPFVGNLGGRAIPGRFEMRPSPNPAPYGEQGLVRIDGDGKRKLFSILPAADNTVAVKAWAILVAAAYNPFDNTSVRMQWT